MFMDLEIKFPQFVLSYFFQILVVVQIWTSTLPRDNHPLGCPLIFKAKHQPSWSRNVIPTTWLQFCGRSNMTSNSDSTLCIFTLTPTCPSGIGFTKSTKKSTLVYAKKSNNKVTKSTKKYGIKHTKNQPKKSRNQHTKKSTKKLRLTVNGRGT